MDDKISKKYNFDFFIKRLMQNFNYSEENHTIVASPSKEDPDYFFEWIRDSGIVMNYIIDLLESNKVSHEKVKPIIKNYIDNHLHFQSICVHENHLINEIEINLGEPKFHVDGSPFKDSWGRPQNDGPALRSIALIRYSFYLLKNIKNSKNYILKKLYDCKYPISHTIIKRDLEYICSVYTNPCFDLWEEIFGDHFYTLMVQQKALELGILLSNELGDFGAAQHYLEISEKIKEKIKLFYKNGKIYSSINITNREYNERDNDMAILLAFLHTKTKFNDELNNTMKDMIIMFENEYGFEDFVGRYKNDEYYDGNPWILTTASLARYYLETNKNEKGVKILNKIFDIEELNKNDKNINKRKMSFAEQIRKDNNEYISATELTWNYIEIMRALELV
jgi:glucoamylase